MLHKSIGDTIVLSLAEDTLRKRYIVQHFHEIGIDNYHFFEAKTPNDEGVEALYSKGKVHRFPNCFRCEQLSCGCANNILIPQQVANWLSFHAIWKYLAGKDGLFLICEDDVAFHKNAIPLLNDLIERQALDDRNILIRLAQSGETPFEVLQNNRLLNSSEKPVMSNAAYIINGSMAALLVKEFNLINTTSDIWLHREIAKRDDVYALTVDPLIATELSYNKEHAKFLSRIHPKGISPEDERRVGSHIKRVRTEVEYKELYQTWF